MFCASTGSTVTQNICFKLIFWNIACRLSDTRNLYQYIYQYLVVNHLDFECLLFTCLLKLSIQGRNTINNNSLYSILACTTSTPYLPNNISPKLCSLLVHTVSMSTSNPHPSFHNFCVILSFRTYSIRCKTHIPHPPSSGTPANLHCPSRPYLPCFSPKITNWPTSCSL